ncbi:MAG: PqqD family protein [Deltaproteobacteria bacterium]|nr:PqqD family protein [Deltaproteobacteria bacterium]
MSIGPDTIIIRNAEAIFAPIDDGLAVFDAERGAYFDFNAIARSIWDTLDAPITPTNLRDRLLDKYDVTREQCLMEVMEFLDFLLEKGLVHVVD